MFRPGQAVASTGQTAGASIEIVGHQIEAPSGIGAGIVAIDLGYLCSGNVGLAMIGSCELGGLRKHET